MLYGFERSPWSATEQKQASNSSLLDLNQPDRDPKVAAGCR